MASESGDETTRDFFSAQVRCCLLHSDQNSADFRAIESHASVRRLQELFAEDTSVPDETRESLCAAIMRSPNVVHTAGVLLQLLENSSLAIIHKSMCQGLKVFTDGGSGRPKKGSTNCSTPTHTSTSYSSASAQFAQDEESGEQRCSAVHEASGTDDNPYGQTTSFRRPVLSVHRNSEPLCPRAPSSEQALPTAMSDDLLAKMADRPPATAQHTVSTGAVTKHSGSRGSRRSSSSSITTNGRSNVFVQRMIKRHGGKLCEITGVKPTKPGEPFYAKGSHIFPYAGLKRAEKNESMWKLLEMFWPAEHVNEIRTVLCQNRNALQNGLLVTSNVHDMWDARSFYLEVNWETVTPLRDRYKVTFQWVDETAPGKLIRYCWRAEDNPSMGADLSELHSKDEIWFDTKDPDRWPLPDPHLLQLRAALCKLRIPKAAGERDHSSYDSTDEILLETPPQSEHSPHPSVYLDLSTPSFRRVCLDPPRVRHEGASLSTIMKWIAGNPDPTSYDVEERVEESTSSLSG